VAPGNETLAATLPDDTGAGTGGFAAGSGARLVARAIISASAVLPTHIRMVDACMFQSDRHDNTPGVKWLVARVRPVVLARKLWRGCSLSAAGGHAERRKGRALNEP